MSFLKRKSHTHSLQQFHCEGQGIPLSVFRLEESGTANHLGNNSRAGHFRCIACATLDNTRDSTIAEKASLSQTIRCRNGSGQKARPRVCLGHGQLCFFFFCDGLGSRTAVQPWRTRRTPHRRRRRLFDKKTCAWNSIG